MPRRETGWSSASSKATKKKGAASVSYGSNSSTISFEVTKGNCKPVIASLDVDYADITITYTLEDDREGNASIRPLYSTGGVGGTYSEMTKGTGGDAKDGLSTSATGQQHTFVWDTVTDLGIDFKGKVYIKIRAFDREGFIGDFIEAGPQPWNVDNAPEAPVITSPTAGFFDKNTTPQIVGTIPNPKSGNSDLHIKVEVATDDLFNDIEQTFESRVDQVGWEYDSNGAGSWTAIPYDGIPVVSDPTLIGNSWRLTIPTENELTAGLKNVRAAAGGVTS